MLNLSTRDKYNHNKYRLRRDVYVPWEIMQSKAFRELSASAIRVFLRLLQKRSWTYTGRGSHKKREYTNGNLAFTYAEAKSFGISSTAFHDSIKRLIDVGFIDLEHQGGAFAKDYSRYAISERWCNYGTENFKCVEKKRSLKPGRDIQSNLRRKKGIETAMKTVLRNNRIIENPTENRSEPLRESAVVGE